MTDYFGTGLVTKALRESGRTLQNHQWPQVRNGTLIYTQNSHYARKFKLEVECGLMGVDVRIPAPGVDLPFGGVKDSQFADIKAQGKIAIDFYTEHKFITECYLPEA